MSYYGIDTDAEAASVLAKLQTLPEGCYEGIDQGEDLDRDGWGEKAGYRDVSFGSVLPSGRMGRTLALGEEDQPHTWTFEVRHVSPTREGVRKMAQDTDKAVIGWEPSANSTPVKPFYYVQYDTRNAQGTILSYTAIRFYETTIGVLA